MNEEQMLFQAMLAVPVKDDIMLKVIRERFMKANRQWSEADAQAEYRLLAAKAIMSRWQKATGRA